jgi:hypothetical protein
MSVDRWTQNDKVDVGFVNDHTAPRWFVVIDGKLEGAAVSWRRTLAKLDENRRASALGAAQFEAPCLEGLIRQTGQL